MSVVQPQANGVQTQANGGQAQATAVVEDKSMPKIEYSAAIKDSDWTGLKVKLQDRDDADLKEYDDDLDALLVFAGLFAGVLTAFIIDVYQGLKPDDDDIKTLLQHILVAEGGMELALKSIPAPVSRRAVTYWFISLTLNMSAALFAIFAKQWLHAYGKWPNRPTTRHRALVLRRFYQDGWHKWRIEGIITSLGVIIQVALVLFVIGLIELLASLTSRAVFIPFVAVQGLVILFAICVILPPLWWNDSAFRSPLAYGFLRLLRLSTHNSWAERDLSITRQRLIVEGALSRAFSDTALLLDIPDDTLTDALDANSDARTAVEGRISELGSSSAKVLSALLTQSGGLMVAHWSWFSTRSYPATAAGEVEEANGAAGAVAGGGEDPAGWKIVPLWGLVFKAMHSPPQDVICLLRHLTCLVGNSKLARAQDNVAIDIPSTEEILRDTIRICSKLDYISAADLIKATTALTVSDLKLSAFESVLGRLESATECRTVVGLSPITPYLPLMASITDAPDTKNAIGRRKTLIARHNTLIARHNSFLCTHRSRYRVTDDNAGEPYAVSFSGSISDRNLELYVATEQAALKMELADAAAEMKPRAAEAAAETKPRAAEAAAETKPRAAEAAAETKPRAAEAAVAMELKAVTVLATVTGLEPATQPAIGHHGNLVAWGTGGSVSIVTTMPITGIKTKPFRLPVRIGEDVTHRVIAISQQNDQILAVPEEDSPSSLPQGPPKPISAVLVFRDAAAASIVPRAPLPTVAAASAPPPAAPVPQPAPVTPVLREAASVPTPEEAPVAAPGYAPAPASDSAPPAPDSATHSLPTPEPAPVGNARSLASTSAPAPPASPAASVPTLEAAPVAASAPAQTPPVPAAPAVPWKMRATDIQCSALCVAAFDPTGKKVATSYNDRDSGQASLKIYEIESSKPVVIKSKSRITGVAWSPTGLLLAFSDKHDVRILHGYSYEFKAILQSRSMENSEALTGIAFSPSGHVLAASTTAGTIRVWDINIPGSRALITTLTGPTGPARSIAFSPDGNFLACAASDGVWVWTIHFGGRYKDSVGAVGVRTSHTV